MSWVRISLPYATYGIRVDAEQNRVVEAAPIGRWMVGRDWLNVVLPWCRRKGADVQRLDL